MHIFLYTFRMPTGGSEAEVARAREVLRNLIELSGASRREVEKRLGEQARGADLGRLLGGRIALKLRHVLDICRVIGIYPAEYFRIVFKEPEQPSPLRQRLDVLLGPGKLSRFARAPGAPPVPATDLHELHRRTVELLRELEKLMVEGDPRNR
jgi:hypothetical protein